MHASVCIQNYTYGGSCMCVVYTMYVVYTMCVVYTVAFTKNQRFCWLAQRKAHVALYTLQHTRTHTHMHVQLPPIVSETESYLVNCFMNYLQTVIDLSKRHMAQLIYHYNYISINVMCEIALFTIYLRVSYVTLNTIIWNNMWCQAWLRELQRRNVSLLILHRLL